MSDNSCSRSPRRFRDARTARSPAAEVMGIRSLTMHAISEEARTFYLALGFSECPGEAMTLVVTLQDVCAVPGGVA